MPPARQASLNLVNRERLFGVPVFCSLGEKSAASSITENDKTVYLIARGVEKFTNNCSFIRNVINFRLELLERV